MKTVDMPTAVDEKLLTMLRAISSPIRYRILQILKERGECQCAPISDALPIAPSTLSQHLKVLREAGLIRGTVDGPSICYCRDEEEIAWLKQHMQRL